MRKLLIALLVSVALNGWSSLVVIWDFDSTCLDILEYHDGEQWLPVPGPYVMVNNEYRIPIESNMPSRFFRVHRQLGVPFIVRENVWPY